jgi:hypothetical protein
MDIHNIPADVDDDMANDDVSGRLAQIEIELQTLSTNLGTLAQAVQGLLPPPLQPQAPAQQPQAPPPQPFPFPPTQPPLVQPPSQQLKFSAPDAFDGTRDKLDTFIRQINLVTNAAPAGTSLKTLIGWALSHMRGGSAGTWADKLVTDHGPGVDYPYRDWDAFLAELRRMFGDPDRAGSAVQKLQKLKQASGKADAYITEFQLLAGISGLQDDALLYYFKAGLQPAILQKIYGHYPMPTTLAGWQEFTRQLDRQYREYLESQKSHASSPRDATKPTHTPAQTTRAPSTDVAPMDVDRTKSRSNPTQPRCFKCGATDHMVRDCPQLRAEIRGMVAEALKGEKAPSQDFPQGQ